MDRVYQIVEYERKPCFQQFGESVSATRRKGDADPDKAIIADTMQKKAKKGEKIGDKKLRKQAKKNRREKKREKKARKKGDKKARKEGEKRRREKNARKG